MLPEAPIPAVHGGVTDTRHETRRVRALPVLEAPEEQEQLAVAELATPEPGTGFRAKLGSADAAPAVLPFPREFTAAHGAGITFGKQPVHQLLTPGFARYLC